MDLAQSAIKKALAGEWQEALKINLELLKENPSDTDTLNRLARAYSETGNTKKALIIAKKVLKLDPINSIALRSVDKWQNMKSKTVSAAPVSASLFLEEPGKTRIVSLINLGEKDLLCNLNCADEVKLTAHTHRLSVNTIEGKYIGRLPDDSAKELIKTIKLGQEYRTFIKISSPSEVKVFIRNV